MPVNWPLLESRDGNWDQLRYVLRMLDFLAIERIASRAAKDRIPGGALERVLIAPTTDSEGKDALRITMVIRPEAVKVITGDSALDLLVELQQELSKMHEERFPIVEFSTQDELNADSAESIDNADDG